MTHSEINYFLKKALVFFLHLIIFLLFALATFNWYEYFKNFAVNSFSHTRYVAAQRDGTDEFTLLVFFIVFCYRTDFLMLRRANQNEFLIPILLITDILCLFICNLAVIIYNNWAFKESGWVGASSLNNVLVAGLIIVAKNWLVNAILKKYRPLPG